MLLWFGETKATTAHQTSDAPRCLAPEGGAAPAAAQGRLVAGFAAIVAITLPPMTAATTKYLYTRGYAGDLSLDF